MTDKQPMQAAGGSGHKGADDGVNDTPGKKGGGGESGGGAYPNPQTGKTPENSGVMGHGGQTDIDYSGPPGAEGNAATKGE
jgi:hypothetical protein